MTKASIAKLARQLYEKVLAEYLKDPGKSYGQILDKYLKEYNDTIADQLSDEIGDIMADVMAGTSVMTAPGQIEALVLSPRLFKNARETARAASKVINQHLRNMATIAEMREALYDGYGYDELLPIKKKLPKYLTKGLTEEKIARLKTKPLKAAYMDVLEAKNDRQLEKALKTALEERARYYALRIAATEEHRAYTLASVSDMIRDNVEYVKWTLSPRHSIPCVCEYWANLDTGYGNGVYEMRNAPMPVYSSHPFCQCKLLPTKPTKGRKWTPSPEVKKAYDYNHRRNGAWRKRPVSDFFP